MIPAGHPSRGGLVRRLRPHPPPDQGVLETRFEHPLYSKTSLPTTGAVFFLRGDDKPCVVPEICLSFWRGGGTSRRACKGLGSRSTCTIAQKRILPVPWPESVWSWCEQGAHFLTKLDIFCTWMRNNPSRLCSRNSEDWATVLGLYAAGRRGPPQDCDAFLIENQDFLALHS